AHAAGMPAVAAASGSLGTDENITPWSAEACAATPDELWGAIEPLLPRDAR
ncbi:phosphoglycolate phosphatase, partial [Pseudomonas stutzeri]|nr:phosphoglycolate phosphatase [Stutzerimonas stutzeri]